MKTFLACNFTPSASQDTYDGQDLTSKVVVHKPTWGPSSGHPAVANHLCGDGSVQTLNKRVNISAYFFFITKNGNDPFVVIQQ